MSENPSQAPLLESALPKVDEHFRQLAEAGAFSGAVLIAKNGRALFSKGYGLANRETKEPVTPQTRFNLASVNKFLTRIAIYQLIEAGKLSPDDKLGKILPDYPNAAAREKVTVQHLLEMKGGIPDIFNDQFKARRSRLRTTDDFLALFAQEPLRFEPGEKTEYSNGGYIILGKIIEQLSGMSYSDYVDRRIAAPAGMTSTALDIPTSSTGAAIGYTKAAPDAARGMKGAANGPAEAAPQWALRPNHDFLPARGSPTGGGYSTVADFGRLDAALRNAILLKPATMDLFFGPTFRTGSGKPSGWAGGSPGVSTGFMMFPDGLSIAVFANLDPPAATSAGEKALALLGKSRPKPAS